MIAPADNKSGTGEKRSTGELVGTITTTASGHPSVVVSGVNWGANLGPVIARSGTIGAARAAVRLGVPSLAVSQGA